MNIKYRGSNPNDGGLPVVTPNLDALLRGHIERVNELQKHIERLEADNAALRQDAERIDWLSKQCITVRIPMRYGSREAFQGCPDLEAESFDIRPLIDAAMREGKKP